MKSPEASPEPERRFPPRLNGAFIEGRVEDRLSNRLARGSNGQAISRKTLPVRLNLPGAGVVLLLCCWLSSAASAAPAAAPADQGQQVVWDVNSLRGIVVVPRLEDVVVSGVTGVKGVQIKGPKFLEGRELPKRLSRYLNAPLTKASLDRMQVDIVKYCREQGHLVVDVFIEEQEVKEGIVQVAVIDAKIGKIGVQYEGGKWFSTNLILGNLHLHPGDVVVESKLNSDLNWLNRNTYQSLGFFDGAFRQVSAGFQQGDLGQTDLKLEVQDRFPLRVFAGYDDAGIKAIGDDQYFAGFNWANVLGTDQRLTYQYITDTSFDLLQEHVASYVVPLPWHHEFTILGAYANLNPNLSAISPSYGSLHNKGDYYQLSGRYTIPLPEWHNYDQQIMAGVDYKNTDEPLFFGNSTAHPLSTNKVAVLQFMLGYSGLLKDRWGKTSWSLQGVYSPGNLVEYNDRAAYYDMTTDPNINPEYVYGRLEIRRETFLPFKFTWDLHAVGQLADADLIPTETFGLGGYDTVRGYDERTVNGDNGWLLSNEIRTPRVPLCNLTRQKGQIDWIQGLVFCDYGGVNYLHPLPGYAANEELLSVGAGVRFQVANNLCVRFDYGVQLDREYVFPNQQSVFFKNEPVSRMHIGVEFSY